MKTKTESEPKKHPIRAIRLAGVPLVCFETADPAATIQGCEMALAPNGTKAKSLNWETAPVLHWDIVRGLVGINQAGQNWCSANQVEPIQTTNPTECLALLAQKVQPSKDEPGVICFFANAHRLITEPPVAQAI